MNEKPRERKPVEVERERASCLGIESLMLLPTRPALHYLSNLLHLLPREAALFVADGVGDPRRVWLRVGDTLRRARRAQTQCHLVR